MKLPKPLTPPNDDQLPDGVYIGLGETPYFRQRCLGSSDLAYLWDEDTADGWWWHDTRLTDRSIKRGILREMLAHRF